jgi:hypothetical protein
MNISYKGTEKEEKMRIQAEGYEFPHLHVEIRKNDFVVKVLGKTPVIVDDEEGLIRTLKWWIKEVREKNWNG